MSANTTLKYRLFEFISSELKDSGLKAFLTNRPEKTSDSMTEFAVIEFPVRTRNVAKGYRDFNMTTSGVIYLFCKAKTDNTPNIDAQSALEDKVLSLFPMTTEGIKCVDAYSRDMGADEYGFQVTSIMFDVKISKLNFNNQ